MLPPCHFLLYSSNTIGTLRKKLKIKLWDPNLLMGIISLDAGSGKVLRQ